VIVAILHHKVWGGLVGSNRELKPVPWLFFLKLKFINLIHIHKMLSLCLANPTMFLSFPYCQWFCSEA
jgi:hypothetical protein